MGRPKAVNIKTFHLYDKLHTTKTKMYSGVEMTTLYNIKETEQFYLSHEVWAYCASKFKAKKKNCTLSVNIPTLTDEKAIAFLAKRGKLDFLEKTRSTDSKEASEKLSKIFPNHKMAYFYDLHSILSAYNHGDFLSYDNDGNVETPDSHQLEQRKYYTSKYHMFAGTKDVPEIKEAHEVYENVPEANKEEKDAKFEIWHNLTIEYAYKNFCLDEVFLNIGLNSVCYPFAFTQNTAEWSKEKYGKLVGYAHAGEIFFVVTPDTVYFEVQRHF